MPDSWWPPASDRRRAVALTASAVLAFLVFQPQVRRAGLVVLRGPFTLTKSVVEALWMLPRLPELERENGLLRAALIQRQLELAGLREALRRTQTEAELEALEGAQAGTVARVIGRAPFPGQQTVLIDHGARQGVGLGTVAINAGGMVGRVTELIGASSATVTLLTDPDSRVAAVIERSRENGLLVGLGRSACELRYLDSETDVKPGDRILTAGLEGPIPKGLRLGTVTAVRRDVEGGWATATIRPEARVNRLEEVLIVPAAGPEADE
ncbi:MAG TPA: rod shape-determining protein MreC [bacterium]